MLMIEQSGGLRPAITSEHIEKHLAAWERENPTRAAVAAALREMFPGFFVFTGGHHIAVHSDSGSNDRLLLVTSDAPDFN
jgi:hypothetical protein